MNQPISVISHRPVLFGIAKHQGVLQLFVLLVITWLPALIGHKAVEAAVSLFPLADSAHPYFVPTYAGMLYLWTPLVIASACLLFLSPGLFLSLALNSAKGIGQWVLSGLVLSLIVVSATAGVAQWILGDSLRGSVFAILVLGCALVCFAFLWVRLVQGHPLAWPFSQPYAGHTLLSMIVVPLALLICLTPKFYWENFNEDAAHGYETARLLLVQPLPFWSATAGYIAAFPGITSMLFAFPASWFIRLFGEVEASARLPLLLYLVALYGVLLVLIEHGKTKPLGLAERWLIWLGLIVYVVTLAFSATYSPYSADIALPATQDTLLMVCFLGFVLAFLKQEYQWMWLFTGLTYLSLPNGALLIGFWLVAVMLIWRPRPWRPVLLAGAGVLVCFIIGAIIPYLFVLLHLPSPGGEYEASELLNRLTFLQWSDWRRLLFMLVPSGILPAVILLAWRWQDRVAQAVTAVTVAYFGFFYIQAYVVLHHFIPVMLLPLVVFWRNDWILNTRYRFLTLVCAGMTGLAALLISLPTNATPYTSARLIGATIQNSLGGYGRVEPAAFQQSEILHHLFPYSWDSSVPLENYSSSPLILNYYAHLEKDATQEVNYVLQSAAQPAPPGMKLLATEKGIALYRRSDSIWASHRAIRPPAPSGSPIYVIPREIIFRSGAPKDGPSIIDVRSVITKLRVNLDSLLDH